MTEQHEILDQLTQAKVLDGIRWAYRSAVGRTLDDYSEDAGYDIALLGSMRYTLFRDRLDRVFHCGSYLVLDVADSNTGLDSLYAQLSDEDIETMPELAAGVVRRSNLNGSPGWAHEKCRFLLASAVFGEIDTLPWPRRSPTKQRVARQPSPESSLQGSLFEDLWSEEEYEALVALPTVDMDTYVVAHTLDPTRQDSELVFGRPQINSGGGPAWHWRIDLLDVPPGPGGRRSDGPVGPLPNAVPDAPVRLRSTAGAEGQRAGRSRSQA